MGGRKAPTPAASGASRGRTGDLDRLDEQIAREAIHQREKSQAVYLLRLQGRGADDIRRLRLLLKLLVRRYELRCLSVEEETQR